MHDAIARFLGGYGLVPIRSRLVATLDCEIHRVQARDAGGASHDLALRIFAPDRQDLDAIRTEVEWLRALSSEGLHVPSPWFDDAGSAIRPWQRDPAAPARHAVLLGWLGGRMHDQGLTPERLRRVGVFTARLHANAQALAARGGIRTTRGVQAPDLPAWAAANHPGNAVFPPRLRELAREAARRLDAELDAFARDARSHGFLHGDLHPWNLLFVRDVAGAIDFSDCGWGPLAHDLATTLQYIRHALPGHADHRPRHEALRDALLAGYAGVRALPPDVLRQVDTLITRRLLGTLEWMRDDWPRLDHRPWGPAFVVDVQQALARYLAS